MIPRKQIPKWRTLRCLRIIINLQGKQSGVLQYRHKEARELWLAVSSGWLASDLSITISIAKIHWSKVMKERENKNLRMLHPIKMSFKYKDTRSEAPSVKELKKYNTQGPV